MKHALPTLALHLFLGETRVGEPLHVAEIQRAIGRTAPDLLRDCVDDQPEAVFASPYGLFGPLTLGNFISQRLVDRFQPQGSLGDATLQVFIEPPNFGARPPFHGRCHDGGHNHDQGHYGNSIVGKGGDVHSVGKIRRRGGNETCGSQSGGMHRGDSGSHHNGGAQPSRNSPFRLLSQTKRRQQRN